MVAVAGGDHEPTSGWLPTGLPKLVNFHLSVQLEALIAQKLPPSSPPVRPLSPK